MVNAPAAAFAIALALATGAAAEPICATDVAVEPRAAWVGQQLVYRLRILRGAAVTSVRFADELAFPSFRVEWLPGQTLDPAIGDVGEHPLVVEERRALFPVRAGTLAIPAARIECETASGVLAAEVAATSVEVREPPAAARLVGRVAANAYLERKQIALGESARFTVALRGEANLWDAAAPLAGDAILGVDVHARESEVERSPGQRLLLERSFAYDLVPRHTGTHVVPPLEVAWLDPASGRVEVERTPELHLEVTEAPADAPETPHANPPARRSSRAPLWIAAGLAIAAGAGLLVRRIARRATPRSSAAPHLALASAAAALGDREAEQRALAAALRAALAVRAPEARSLAAEELVATTDGARREAALALADLDRARFAPATGGAARLDAGRVRALVRALS